MADYDERAQHERAVHAMALVRDDIADGRDPDSRLVGISLACACDPCLDGMVEQARELWPWLAVTAVGRFVSQRCELAPGAGATTAEVCEAYRRWARDNGEDTSMSAVALGRALSAQFDIRSKASQGIRVYQGLAVRQ